MLLTRQSEYLPCSLVTDFSFDQPARIMTIYYATKALPACRAITLAGCIALTACNDNTELVDIIEDGEVGVMSLKASSEDIQLAAGQTFKLSATALYDSGGQSTFTDPITWTSQNDNIATVNNDGAVTAVSPGDVTISYQWRRISGTANVTVTAAELVSINFSTSQLEGNECSETSITANGMYSDGTTQPLSSISQWSTNNDAVVQVVSQDANSANLLLIDSGIAQITMSSGLVTGSLPVVVTDTLSALRIISDVTTLENGSEQALQISGIFTDETEQIVNSAASYRLSDIQNDAPTNTTDSIVLDSHPSPDNPDAPQPESETDPTGVILATSETIDIVQQLDTSLVIRARQPGTTTLTASCGGLTADLSLTVFDPPTLQSLSIADTGTEIEPGGLHIPVLSAYYSDGSEQTVSDSTQWSILSGDADSFQLDSTTGQVTANTDIVVEKSIILQATYEEINAVTEIFSNRGITEEITNTQLYFVDQSGQAIALTDSNISLGVGETLQLRLKTVYNTGREDFPDTNIYWSNLNPEIASIDGAGLMTTNSAGSSSIFAIHNSVITTFQFIVVDDAASIEDVVQ